MKVKDLISQEVDIDVYSDYTDELNIAFVGPLFLTENGKREFADVLNYDVEIGDIGCFVHCEDDLQLGRAIRFFNAAAGWCSEDDYDKWFELSY